MKPEEMIPRPLSEFPVHQVRLVSHGAGRQYDALLGLVMRYIAIVADIENLQYQHLTMTHELEFTRASRLVSSLRPSNSGLRNAMEEVLEAERPDDAELIIRAWERIIGPVVYVRHRFAHWLWATTLPAPDALVLISPGVQLQHVARASETIARATEEWIALPPFDRTKAWVFDAPLLERFALEAMHAHGIAGLTLGLVKETPRSAQERPLLRDALHAALGAQRQPTNKQWT